MHERLQLSRQAVTDRTGMLIDFTKLPPSPKRALKRRVQFRINTIEEERQVLALQGIPVDVMADVPSLGWFAMLSDDLIAESLKQFSARELAPRPGVAPDEVLSRLSAFMPAKKYELLKQYQRSLAPNRNSTAFQALHRLAIENLKTTAEPEPESESDPKAA